jgi:Lrp/AsnC family transcriptional regulator, leucine-responsive regulatory protein
MTTRLDAFDLHILKIVQQNNLATHREIAEEVNLSTPAVARRLQRLRSEGVIWKDVSIVRPEEVGNRLTIVVNVAVESEALDQLDAMKQRFSRCPQIQQCYYVTGEADFVLIMSVKDMSEYEALTRSLFFEAGNVKHFYTAVAMQRVKVSMEIPVGKDA